MKRQVQGLSRSVATAEVADGLYLVRIQHARHRWQKQKRFYEICFYVLEPQSLLGGSIIGRLSCCSKSLWKLGWFLRDFRYSQELLERDEIDTGALVGLRGVVQIGHEIIDGRSEVILKAFAPATDWPLVPVSPSLTVEVA